MGAGRAGSGLARALRAAGVDVCGVHGHRDPGGPDRVSVGTLPDSLARSAVVLVTVRDSQIDDALRELLAGPLPPDAVVVHASGSAEPAVLEDIRAAGHAAGTFHPLVPLADPARAAEVLRGAFIGIDGDEPARAASRELAAKLGAQTLDIPPGEKARYHAAAVIVSNFPAVLLRMGEDVLVEAGIPLEQARTAARALLSTASANLAGGDTARSLTGPIVRGDVGTVQRHLAALASNPEALAVYKSLSLAALPIAREGGTSAAALAELERVLLVR